MMMMMKGQARSALCCRCCCMMMHGQGVKVTVTEKFAANELPICTDAHLVARQLPMGKVDAMINSRVQSDLKLSLDIEEDMTTPLNLGICNIAFGYSIRNIPPDIQFFVNKAGGLGSNTW